MKTKLVRDLSKEGKGFSTTVHAEIDVRRDTATNLVFPFDGWIEKETYREKRWKDDIKFRHNFTVFFIRLRGKTSIEPVGSNF